MVPTFDIEKTLYLIYENHLLKLIPIRLNHVGWNYLSLAKFGVINIFAINKQWVETGFIPPEEKSSINPEATISVWY